MSNDPGVEALHTVDDRSKVVAVLTTVAAFGAGMFTVGDIEFVSIAAAAIGIGARFGSVWWGARIFVDRDSAAVADQPTAGRYHHGAVGVALVLAGALLRLNCVCHLARVPFLVEYRCLRTPTHPRDDGD